MTENIYDTIISELWKTTLNLYKETYESFGFDLGKTDNEIDYYNFLKSDPLEFISQSDPSTFKGKMVFTDYKGPKDGSIGSTDFPQGKGKAMDPNGQYWPFYVFGFGKSPAANPTGAFSKRSGVECCKLAIDTVLGYLKKGCKTIGDVICMYHGGMPSYDNFIKYYSSVKGVKDMADGRFVSSQEMIQRQNYYQQHLVDYVHMSNKTPLERKYSILFPLVSFISRQEQGVNCELACKQALNEMGIT